MQTLRKIPETVRRVVIPLVVAVALVAVTILISGSYLFSIEDVILNRIVAGASGTPDWRVQVMNPLLAQILTVFYRIVPGINWYAMLLFAMLAGAVALLAALAARKRGGLLPALLVLAPLTVLMTYSLMSTVVCAISAGVGVLAFLDGLSQKPKKMLRTAGGGVLFALGAMLSLTLAATLAVAALLCYLPGAARNHRARGAIKGVPMLLIVLAALFGYSSLMYASPELSAYRSNYAAYEKLQHSSLKLESEALMHQYSDVMVTEHEEEEAEAHEHSEDEDEAAHADEGIPETVFDAVGWNLNDAAMFFGRNAMDTGITDPAAIETLLKEAKFVNFAPSFLLKELFATIKKPQFLLVIGLFVLSALATVITSRRKGLVALLCAVFAFGGHIAMLATYHDTFAEIAPFYLLALAVLLYHFDGEDANEWYRRVLPKTGLRVGAGALTVVLFSGATAGLLYYFQKTPVNDDVGGAYNFITEYTESHPDMLFIGDNPHERYKPSALSAPRRGADSNLMAGGYDLYSPRRAALMQQYTLTNPLPDSVNRKDIGYVLMSYDVISLRLADAHGVYLREATDILTVMGYSQSIVGLTSYTQDEMDTMITDAETQEKAMQDLFEALAKDQMAQDGELVTEPSAPGISDVVKPGALQTPPAPSATNVP